MTGRIDPQTPSNSLEFVWDFVQKGTDWGAEPTDLPAPRAGVSCLGTEMPEGSRPFLDLFKGETTVATLAPTRIYSPAQFIKQYDPQALKQASNSCIDEAALKNKNAFMSMNIEQILTNATSVVDLLLIARVATTHLSFWGSRYVCVTGYNGTLDLDALAAKVIELVERSPHFNEQERTCGREIASLIDRNIYDAIDIQVNNSNCLTSLFVQLRDVCTVIFLFFRDGITGCLSQGTRWDWKEAKIPFLSLYHNVFELYTAEQFKNQHGVDLEETKPRGYRVLGTTSRRSPTRHWIEKSTPESDKPLN